jgi:ligand-binding SRPBCC domain-containing protein
MRGRGCSRLRFIFIQGEILNESSVYTFEKSVLISAPIDKLFAFHADTNNLPLISPKNIKTKILQISEIPLQKGSTIKLEIKKGIVKLNWDIVIKDFDPSFIISDLQTKGLFKYWLHKHIFSVEGDYVKMTDRVEFIPPFGFLGRLAAPLIFMQLKAMFKYRHEKTKLLFIRS